MSILKYVLAIAFITKNQQSKREACACLNNQVRLNTPSDEEKVQRFFITPVLLECIYRLINRTFTVIAQT